MKKVFFYIVAVTLTIFLSSCDDDDKSKPNLLEETSRYLPLQVGNYWVYDVYSTSNRTGDERLLYIDTIKIKEERVINGKNYFHFESKGEFRNENEWVTKYWITDSIGYLVDLRGTVRFSNVNFTDTLKQISYYRLYHDSDNWEYDMSLKMEKANNSVIVPAGSFSGILDYRGTVIVNDRYAERYENPRYTNSYFVKDVGIILENNFYVISGDWIEHRLSKYHINGTTYPAN